MASLLSNTYFSRSNISNANISETVRAITQKCIIWVFIDFDFCYQMAQFEKCYSVNLTYIFKVKTTNNHAATLADLPPLVRHSLSSRSCYFDDIVLKLMLISKRIGNGQLLRIFAPSPYICPPPRKKRRIFSLLKKGMTFAPP